MSRGFFTSFIVVAILLSSCGPAPSTSSTDQPTPSPTPIPEEYSDLGDLFESRLESGEWTEEEGLVSMLKLAAGETDGEEFLVGSQVVGPGGTGILLRAQNYLQTGTNEAAKTEIRRLLAALAPSIEALDLYSTPAESSANKSPGHAAQVDCTTFQREGFPADTATSCFQYYETVVDTYMVRIYFPEGWGDDEARRPFLEATQQAVADSMAAYGELGLTHRTLVVFFTLLDYSPSGRPADLFYASADLALPGAAITNCRVAVYPAAAEAGRTRSMDVFKQILAHEIFHCYQFWNYNDASQIVPYAENKWWVEGTAEYFGNFVYPPVNAEYEYLPAFDRRSPNRSTINMAYENFMFFQYLANEIGNDGILRLIESLPTAPGASQADALSAFPDIEELFHNFGRAYLDGEVMDSGGGAVPGNPRINDIILFDETFVDAIPPVDRFILRRFKLVFPEKHHFELETGSDGAEGSNGTRLGEAGEWEPLTSSEFDVSCGNREQVFLVTTSAAEGQYHFLLDVTVTDGPECDECLLGTWELDNATYEAYFNASPAGSDETVEYRGVSGRMWADYGEDGVIINGWTDFTINYLKTISGVGDKEFAIILNGTGQANFLTSGGMLSYSESLSDYEIAVNMDGSPVASTGITSDSVDAGLFSAPIQYVCTEETLRFISLEYPQLNELVFLRGD